MLIAQLDLGTRAVRLGTSKSSKTLLAIQLKSSGSREDVDSGDPVSLSSGPLVELCRLEHGWQRS